MTKSRFNSREEREKAARMGDVDALHEIGEGKEVLEHDPDAYEKGSRRPAHSTETEEWEKGVRSAAVPSKTTKSGWEVVYDPEALIREVKSLLKEREEKRREQLLELRKWARSYSCGPHIKLVKMIGSFLSDEPITNKE